MSSSDAFSRRSQIVNHHHLALRSIAAARVYGITRIRESKMHLVGAAGHLENAVELNTSLTQAPSQSNDEVDGWGTNAPPEVGPIAMATLFSTWGEALALLVALEIEVRRRWPVQICEDRLTHPTPSARACPASHHSWQHTGC